MADALIIGGGLAGSARYCGLLNTGGYAQGGQVDEPPGVMNFCFGRRCFFGYVHNPNGEVWWFANPPSATEQSRTAPAAISTEQWRTRLIELLAPRWPIEDAVTLARCLRDQPSTEHAFASDERLRRQRVERIVEQGKRNGDQKAVGPVRRLLRDYVIMPVIARRAARTTNNPMAWSYDHHIDWDERVAPAPVRR